MSNIELARLLLVAMQNLAYMVVWYVRGNIELAKSCEVKYSELLDRLDHMCTLEKELGKR